MGRGDDAVSVMQIRYLNCPQHRRGPSVSDRCFPSELDLSGSTKVIACTCHLEALGSEVELFFVCILCSCSFCLMVLLEESSKTAFLSVNQTLHRKVLWGG